MGIIRRLLIKEWLLAFAGALFVLFLLVTIANVVSELLRATTTIDEIFKHYLLELPQWMSKMLPLACLMATLFGLNKLRSRNELIAILVSGFDRNRILLVLAQLSFAVGCLHLFIGGQVMPYAQAQKKVLLERGGANFRSAKSGGIKTSAMLTGKIWYRNHNYFVAYEIFDKSRDELRGADIYFYDQDHLLKQLVRASRLTYDGSSGRWVADQGSRSNNLAGAGFPVVQSAQRLAVEIKETPADFKRIESNVYELNMADLYRYILKIQKFGLNSAEFEVLFYDKIASAFSCLVFGLLSCFALFRPNQRQSSFGKNVIFVLLFTVFYWLVYSSFLALGSNNKIPPLLAVLFTPLLCFVIVVITILKTRRLV